MSQSETFCVEDNPYAEIYFEKNVLPDFYSLMPERTIQLGSFSKIVSPGMRLGWATGPKEVMKKMTIAKQATDLHTSNLMQRIVFQFLLDNSLEDHLNSIRSFYKEQAEFMMRAMKSHFPNEVRWIIPKGGMFIWATLPEPLEASTLLEKAMEQNVLFVPGENFYAERKEGVGCLRMNFSNPSKAEINKGITILGELITSMLKQPL
jgi:2-aminoadipate transaminase